jgi:small subunit ribosomal protein S9
VTVNDVPDQNPDWTEPAVSETPDFEPAELDGTHETTDDVAELLGNETGDGDFPSASDVEPHELPDVVPSVVLPVVGARPIQTVGRRKEAVARIRLVPGSGSFTLNGRSLDNYFPNKVHQQLIKEPLVNLEKAETYDVLATLHGGGVTGQAGALRLAIARALIEVDENDRPALKKSGFLTRDARAKERKKYGLKKARKAPQYSKR